MLFRALGNKIASRVLPAFVAISTLLAAPHALAQQAYQFPSPLTAGSGTSTQSVTVSIATGGTIGQALVVTGGISNADFVSSSGGTCAAGASYAAGASCSMSVTFQPQAPGGRSGAIVLLGSNGAVMGDLPLYGIGIGPVSVMVPATINTVAGNSQWVYRLGDDGIAATESPLYLPSGIAVDPAGNLYIADTNNNRIRFVNAQTGVITTVAGDGNAGFANDGQPATAAQVSSPAGIVLDGAGNLYIADSGNHAIRKLTLATGALTTIAGQLGTAGFSGDGGPGTLATLDAPEGLAFDPAGNLYIADTGNQVIRKIDATTGIITTYAGVHDTTGYSGDGQQATSALLNMPWGLATDGNGNLFIADFGNSVIRKVSSSGIITTIAGTGSTGTLTAGQAATATNFKDPAAVVVDVAGNIYVADSGHNLVLKISAANQQVSVTAGNGGTNFVGDTGPATLANLYGPYALALDSKGNLYTADMFHNRVREVFNAQATLSYQPIQVNHTSTPQNQTVENDGNANLQWTTLTPDQNSAIDSADTTCSVGTSVTPLSTCVLAAEFQPQVTGNPVTATIQLASNATNSADTITLSGESDALQPTTTTVTCSPDPSALNTVVTCTAAVTGENPSGSIQFYDGNTLLGSSSANSSGVAVFNTSSLALGSHNITADFVGDSSNNPSNSAVFVQVVKQTPAVTLASSLNPSQVGQSTTLTATVTASTVQPTGSVVFTAGSTTLGTAALNASGVATLSTTAVPAGTQSVVATYSGDTSTLTGTATLTQTVNKWSTTTTVTSSQTPSPLGTAVTFTIAVAPTSTAIPSGTVTLLDGSTTLATMSLGPAGTTIYTTANLTVGTHSITAQYLGDATNDVSTSAALSQVVQKISTTTTLTSSANPSNGGATIQLIANISASSTNATAGELSGTVTFTQGSTTLGTATVSSNGTATLSISTLSVGSHSIVATYSGDSSYSGSGSQTLSQTVQLATTSVQLNSSLSPSYGGSKVVFTAVVSGNGGVPGGTVNFLDGGVSIGGGTLNASGQAIITISSLTPGNHTITASYAGDSLDSASTSVPLVQVVQLASTTISLISSNNPAIAGTTITFGATVSSNGGIPSGQLQLMEGSNVLATSTISSTGVAQFTLSTLSIGTHTLTAYFAGSTLNGAASSAPLTQTINAGTSTAVLTSSANPSAVGSSVTFTATVSGQGNQPTGTIVFSDGANAIGTAAINGQGIATISTSSLTFGVHTIIASYAGDSTHNASAPATLTQTVQQSTTTSLSSNTNPSLVGNSIVLTATVTASGHQSLTGTVSFYDAGNLLGTSALSNGVATLSTSTLAAGSHVLVAKYSGDTSNQPSQSATLTQVVNEAGTTVTVTSSANPAVTGNTVIFTATVVSTGEAPAGSIEFLDGSTVLGTSAITNGVASLSINTLTAGQHAITARYSGSSSTETSTSPVLTQVIQQPTSVLLGANANPISTAQSVTFTAAVSGNNPTGTITFTDGSTLLGQASLVAGTATLTVPSLASGSHTITAKYSGDSFNLTSTSATLTETVNLRPSSTSMTSSSQTYATGDQVTVVAVVHTDGPIAPTGTVTFTNNGQTLGTAVVSSSGAATFTFDPQGSSYSIVATYSGDAVYAPSTASAYTITQGAGTNFNVSVTPSSVTMASGDHITLNLALSSNGAFADTVSLGCLNLPTDATCTFSVEQVKLAANGSATAQVVLDTGLPLGAGPRASVRTGGSREALIAFPAAILLGMMTLFSRRRRGLSALLSILLLVVAGAGLSGCGSSLNVSKTPPGSYNIQVIATGSTTGISETANIPLTVQ